MKFSKHFSFYKIPEWQEYYLDYYTLKIILYFISNKIKKKKLTLRPAKTTVKPSQGRISKRLSSIGELTNHLEKNKFGGSDEFTKYNNMNVRAKKGRKSIALLRRGSTIKYDEEININNFNNLIKMARNPNKKSKDSDENSVYLEEKHAITEDKLHEIMKRTEEMQGLPDTLKMEHFLKVYKEKIEIVDKFFSLQISQFETKYLNIAYKMNQIKNNLNDDSSEESNSQLNNHERAQLDFATSMKRAISTIYNFTSWLHSYYSINLIAIKKIQFKAIKVFNKKNIKNIEDLLHKEDSQIQFFNNLSKLINLRHKIKALYADGITGGNLIQAGKELEKKLQGEGQLTQKKMVCLILGMLFVEIFFYMFLAFNPKEKKNSVKPFFPAFNFSLCIIVCFFGVALNLEILQRYKINYIYIFEVEPSMRIGSWEVLQVSLCMLTIWLFFMICSKITYNYSLFGHSFYYIFPLISTSALILFLFLPFNYFYYHFRMGIIHIFFGNLFPIGKKAVLFRDFLFGDTLTSLSKPINSLVLAGCILACKECRDNNKRISSCNRDTIYCLIINIYFPINRVMQCLNRYYYTHLLWPHFVNLVKNIVNILSIYFIWNYGRNKESNYAHALCYVFGLFATTFQLGWDVYVDWGLGRPEAKIFLLRDKIIYPRKFYYSAILLDTLIRFSWLLSYIELNKNKFDEWKNLMLSLLEIIRRIVWCIIRIENENTTNPEKYRTILTIPELPDL